VDAAIIVETADGSNTGFTAADRRIVEVAGKPTAWDHLL
jgi:hypothetical protein